MEISVLKAMYVFLVWGNEQLVGIYQAFNSKETFTLIECLYMWNMCMWVILNSPMPQRLSLSLSGCSHMVTHLKKTTTTKKQQQHRFNPCSNCLVAWTAGYCATSDAYTSKSYFLMLASFFFLDAVYLLCVVISSMQMRNAAEIPNVLLFWGGAQEGRSLRM